MIEKEQREKKEWIKAFEKAKEITGFNNLKIEFGGIEKITKLAEYDFSSERVNFNEIVLRENISKNVKLATSLHEHGHHFIKYFIMPLTLPIAPFYYFFQEPIEEFIAEKFTQFSLIKDFGIKKGIQIFKEYTEFYKE